MKTGSETKNFLFLESVCQMLYHRSEHMTTRYIKGKGWMVEADSLLFVSPAKFYECSKCLEQIILIGSEVVSAPRI